jgi:hypothetical protein
MKRTTHADRKEMQRIRGAYGRLARYVWSQVKIVMPQYHRDDMLLGMVCGGIVQVICF